MSGKAINRLAIYELFIISTGLYKSDGLGEDSWRNSRH